ncbi:MAG TPA: DUF4340 domain-containing protein [Chthoniobacterales bacterium]|nr:DUF4340 domain-containing protein [Chthoniobacterales bacterium]
MKIRSLIVAVFILLVLVAALYWSGHRKPAEETAKASAETPPTILKLDEAAITKLELKRKDAEPIVLTKNTSGTWQIEKPRVFNADQSTVSGVISTLSSLNSERLVEDKASDLKQYGLDHSAFGVDITEKDNKTQKLLIGDETPAGSAFYAMLASAPRVFTMASYNKTSIDKSLNDLRDKRLLTASLDKISRIELIRKNQTIEFGRNKDDWQILKPKPLRADSSQVGELARKLTDARMDLSGSDKDLKEAASAFARATAVVTAKVTDQSGTQELQVRKAKDKYYAKSSAIEGAYKVDSDLGQALDKGLDDFRNKKLFDFGFNDPIKIEMHNGSKAYFLSRSGNDWWSNGKKMDAGSVQDLVSKLRDLAASKFVDSGFANPSIEVTVASDDGKRVEKASIAKPGLAKRENEPTLYQLDSSAVDALQKAADDIKPAAGPAK